MKIELRNLSVVFANKAVLDNITLTIQTPDTCMVLGDSGSGKTTLLRVISGLQKASSGSCKFTAKPSISYSFQEPRLFSHLSVRKNLSMFKPERAPDKILTALNLIDVADALPDTLSGGMQKRVSVARTLSKKADIYLFDEPSAGQDPKHAAIIADTIKQYTCGSICIIATHNPEYFKSFATSTMTVHSGKITQV